MSIPFVINRNRTPSSYIGYDLYLYFSGLSLRQVSEILSVFIKRNHVSIWNWIQKYKPQKISSRRRKILEYIIDDTLIKVGSELIWLWVAIEPKNREILALSISKERNTFIAERYLSEIVKEHNKCLVSTDGGTWYQQACGFLTLKYHIHSSFEKSIIERTIQYIKDRIESLDDYFPCRKEHCNLTHVKNWLNLFVNIHNKEVIEA